MSLLFTLISLSAVSLVSFSTLVSARQISDPCAETGAGSKPNAQLRVPALVVDQFLRPDRRNDREMFWIFPDSVCVSADTKIEILDADNQSVGVLSVSRIIRENLVAQQFAEKQEPTLQAYLAYLRKLGLSEYRAIDLFLRLTYGVYNFSEHSIIRLAAGTFSPRSNYVLAWNPYVLPSTHFAANALDYQELIAVLQEPKFLVLEVGANNLDSASTWRIPYAISANRFPRVDEKRLMDFNGLSSIYLGIQPAKLPVTQVDPIVVYSNGATLRASYNLVSTLAVHGFKIIYWSPDLVREWQGRARDPADIPKAEISNIKNPGSAYVIDVRSLAEFHAGSIPGAIHFSHEELNNRALKEKIIGLDKTKDVILIGGGAVDPGLTRLYLHLRDAGFTKIRAYLPGYPGWYAHSVWLGASAGYTIMTPPNKQHRTSN